VKISQVHLLTVLCNLIVDEGRILNDWKFSSLLPVLNGKDTQCSVDHVGDKK